MNFLGPYLSLKVPAMTEARALIILLAETAPEMAALDQPNLSIRGLTKTPKLY